MTRQAFRLVLLVSCAHALVHIYELTFPSVEQLVQAELEISSTQIGVLGTAWALPFGLGAAAAGWLADRFGTKRVLVMYLVGCGLLSGAVALAPSYGLMLVAMFLMGTLASLYHPAGLSLVSRATSIQHRGLALGYHGVFGSAGIAAAPFLAGLLLAVVNHWRNVYVVLMAPGILLGVWLLLRLGDEEELTQASATEGHRPTPGGIWRFAVYCVLAWFVGLTYRAFTLFLPRYLGASGLEWMLTGVPAESARSYLAGFVLTVGIAGQYLAGHLAGRYHLERLLAITAVLNVPFLLWMGQSEGFGMLVATIGFAFVHFMMQPIGNSLVAKYISSRRRSLGYGVAFLVSFGAGSLGAIFAGFVAERYGLARLYPILALLMAAAAGLAALLWLIDARSPAPVRE